MVGTAPNPQMPAVLCWPLRVSSRSEWLASKPPEQQTQLENPWRTNECHKQAVQQYHLQKFWREWAFQNVVLVVCWLSLLTVVMTFIKSPYITWKIYNVDSGEAPFLSLLHAQVLLWTLWNFQANDLPLFQANRAIQRPPKALRPRRLRCSHRGLGTPEMGQEHSIKE